MRRVHLRGRPACRRGRNNILKRLLIHVSGFNLGLMMRRRFGVGTPRSLQGLRVASLCAALIVAALWRPLARLLASQPGHHDGATHPAAPWAPPCRNALRLSAA
jgi:hypothetical protein